ncbi:hypothetical protein KJ365_14500 [Glaciecola sp. XM2]|jgi:hypothetical protein|uniref:hypothetical protein n=1 Tax=Glaciecola sp. XM2 TaxID=1914931 RepID=UPI001BDEAD87|nr:hypothetical protein [Glaciecola sp. XM2]MBT1452099.1 hypothetical protein [Glaciecola sp. XM2]
MGRRSNISFRLLKASHALEVLLRDNNLQRAKESKLLSELNEVGINVLKSKQHGEWFQILKTIYRPHNVASELSKNGFIVLTLNQAIFIFSETGEKTDIEKKLQEFFELKL